MGASRKDQNSARQLETAATLDRAKLQGRDCLLRSLSITDPILRSAVMKTLDVSASMMDEIETLPQHTKSASSAASLLWFALMSLSDLTSPTSIEDGGAGPPADPLRPIAESLLLLGAVRAKIVAARSYVDNGGDGGSAMPATSQAAEFRRLASLMHKPTSGQVALAAKRPNSGRHVRRVLAKLKSR